MLSLLLYSAIERRSIDRRNRNLLGQARIALPHEIEHQRRELAVRKHHVGAWARIFDRPPLLREHHETPEVPSRPAELVRVNAAEEGAMVEPVQACGDCTRIIDNGNALEIDDRFFVWRLPEKGIHHFGLAHSANQKFYVAPRHHDHVAARFEPDVFPNCPNISIGVIQGAFTRRIHKSPFVGLF
ncbi:hypothetical protein ACNJYD_08795 [Bradyrhizobium sp. DASA03005]|uniref:hypothetical protein n=1 Tax=Bradyrhizobium sp. SPXBL-02 TaxID=3395912 RepID=UPI003F6F7AE7